LLEKEDFVKHVFEAGKKEEFFSALTLQSFDLVLLDLQNHRNHSLDLFQALKEKTPASKVINAHGFRRERSLSLNAEIRGEQYSLPNWMATVKC